jgi:glycosyltransferase involved in cell wall biosynthesis
MNGQIQPRVSVVVPARNEARNIGHVLATLPPDIYEVLLVDGGSTDGTIAAARTAMPEIRVMSQPGTGKGDALAAGLEACTGDVVVMLDADGSADGREIPRFVAALTAGADLAKGSRFLDGGGSGDLTRVRRAGNRLLCGIVNAVYHTRYSDLCYGYNAGWIAPLRQLKLDCAGFEIETVLSIRSAKSRLRITEVPSFEAPRLFGESNLRTFRDGWRVLCAIAREHRSAKLGPSNTLQAVAAPVVEALPEAAATAAVAAVALTTPSVEA